MNVSDFSVLSMIDYVNITAIGNLILSTVTTQILEHIYTIYKDVM